MRKPSPRQTLIALAGIVAALGIGVPAALSEPASITGTITADDTGDPLLGVCVFAYNADTFEFVDQACTSDTGAYELAELETGIGYRLEAAAAAGYRGEWAFDKASMRLML